MHNITFKFPEPHEDNNFTICPNCGAVCGFPDWKGHNVFLWANQYGWEKRLFCYRCNLVLDFDDTGVTHLVRNGLSEERISQIEEGNQNV